MVGKTLLVWRGEKTTTDFHRLHIPRLAFVFLLAIVLG